MGCFITKALDKPIKVDILDKPINVEIEQSIIIPSDVLFEKCLQLIEEKNKRIAEAKNYEMYQYDKYLKAWFKTSSSDDEALLKTIILTKYQLDNGRSRSDNEKFFGKNYPDVRDELFKKKYSNVRRDSITEELKKYIIGEIADEVISFLVYESYIL
jgi:hypothetical protein